MDVLAIILPIGLIAIMIGLSYLLSENKKAVSWALIGKGIALQLVFALIVLKTEAGNAFFRKLSDIVKALLDYTGKGAQFVFGVLADADHCSLGYIFCFNVLPTIIFFSSFMAILYHLGIMQKIIYVIALVMQKTLKTSGAESLSASANIFVGQTEAPLVVKPYIEKMTRSEIMCVMTGGMATVAGGVMASYVGMLNGKIDNIAGHLMAASVMAAPAGMVFSKILVPETGVPETSGKMEFNSENIDSSVIDACSRGCSEGMSLAINVAAMLIGFTAMIALINDCWGGICGFIAATDHESWATTWMNTLVGPYFGWLKNISTLQDLLGYLLWPVTLLLGICSEDRVAAGGLIGQKTILNEFVAYSQLADYANGKVHEVASDPNSPVVLLAPKTKVILSYVLCGFANFSSIGIQIAGIGGLAPKRRSEIANLAIKALLAATFTSFFTASIASMLYTEPKVNENMKPQTAVEQPVTIPVTK